MSNREQFESWVRENWPEQSLARFNTGEYQGFTVEHCWNAWQASRQALVVELPVAEDFTDIEDAMYVVNRCEEAIKAAGVRVKP